jgi:hypothetical protein
MSITALAPGRRATAPVHTGLDGPIHFGNWVPGTGRGAGLGTQIVRLPGSCGAFGNSDFHHAVHFSGITSDLTI